MKQLLKHKRFLIFLAAILMASTASAQYKIQGTVFDSSKTFVLEAVSVLTTAGGGTTTDENGRYQITVGAKDSIWFSYLGKPTIKFPVLKIADINQFDIALRVSIATLSEVKIFPRSYKQDSVQNRRDYAKAFNYTKPSITSTIGVGPTGVGFDVQEIIRMFQFRKNKSMESFRERLLQQEREKFIDHRFNRSLIRRITQIENEDDLEEFIILYRPSYSFTLSSNDYNFHLYIKLSWEEYLREKAANK